MKRKTPLRRTRMRKKPPRRLDSPDSNSEYMGRVRALGCCRPNTMAAMLLASVRGLSLDLFVCNGRIHAHHAGARPGTGLKASDLTCIPLCDRHHRQWHDANGVFKGWTKADRRKWADAAIEDVQRILGMTKEESDG